MNKFITILWVLFFSSLIVGTIILCIWVPSVLVKFYKLYAGIACIIFILTAFSDDGNERTS